MGSLKKAAGNLNPLNVLTGNPSMGIESRAISGKYSLANLSKNILGKSTVNDLYKRELNRFTGKGEFEGTHNLFDLGAKGALISAVPNKNTWTEAWRKAFIKPKDDGGQTEYLHDQELIQAKQAGDLRLQAELRPRQVASDDSIPNRLRRQMAMRTGLQSTVTGAGSLVAPTQLKTKTGQ